VNQQPEESAAIDPEDFFQHSITRSVLWHTELETAVILDTAKLPEIVVPGKDDR